MTRDELIYVQAQLVRGERGRVHERFKIKGRWLSDERCNLDQTTLKILDDMTASDVDATALCGHCFSGGTA